MSTDRDRDAEGRARNARPRDALGRPLPYGAVGEERAPEGVVRAPAESLAEAQELLDAGRPFHAHEVLEDAWKSAPEAERQLWRGLAQLAVGLTHATRGNARRRGDAAGPRGGQHRRLRGRAAARHRRRRAGPLGAALAADATAGATSTSAAAAAADSGRPPGRRSRLPGVRSFEAATRIDAEPGRRSGRC